MTSGNDQLHQRWSFTAPSATLPGARPRMPSTALTSLRSSLVTGGSRTSRHLDGADAVAADDGLRAQLPAFPPPVVEEYASAADVFLPAADEDDDPGVPWVPDPHVPDRATSTTDLDEAAAMPSPSAPRPAGPARQRRVGGVSVFAAVLVLFKVLEVVVSHWQH